MAIQDTCYDEVWLSVRPTGPHDALTNHEFDDISNDVLGDLG